jgi:glycerophosphoryl diester phosphodiesterase
VTARFPFLDHGGVLAFAHRGGSSVGPENTMPAFQNSIDLGFVYLETDVHLSADGVLYAFHDANLKARTGLDAHIADLDAVEIDALLVDEIAPIPRFDEIVLTWPHARLNIDTKSDATVMPLIAALRSHDAIDRVCIGSFVDHRIRKCRTELGPELCTSMGPLEASRLLLASKGLADPSLIVAGCAQIPMKKIVPVATPALVSLAHNLDIQVHVWTIDEPDDMHLLLDIDIDGIMTDQPRILRDILIKRGVWAPEGLLR